MLVPASHKSLVGHPFQQQMLTEAAGVAGAAEVRKAPGWPRSWANFSLLSLYSHRNA